MPGGRPPTLWCDLIFAAMPAFAAARFDHVRVQRALHQEPGHGTERARFLLEDADELLAHDLPLGLGVGDACEPCEEARLGACTCTSGTRKWPPNVSTTCSASLWRMKP